MATDTIATELEVLDERFAGVSGDGRVERLFTGCRWAEGPAHFAAGRYLVWDDIPNDRMLRWVETSGSVSVFRAPAGYANGNTVDPEGRLVTCEQGNRRVTRTEHDGSVTDTRRNHIRGFTVTPEQRLSGGEVVAQCSAGVFDGMRVDADGRLWAAAGDGLHCFDPDGTLLGKLRLPEICSNLTFGGVRRNWLFVTASTSLYAIRLKVNGATRPRPAAAPATRSPGA